MKENKNTNKPQISKLLSQVLDQLESVTIFDKEARQYIPNDVSNTKRPR